MKLYVEKETKEFFHKYKAPLLSLFLNDPDIDLSLKWKNSFILGKEQLINKISDVNKIPRIASSDLLPKLSSSYRKYSAQSAPGMRFEPNCRLTPYRTTLKWTFFFSINQISKCFFSELSGSVKGG